MKRLRLRHLFILMIPLLMAAACTRYQPRPSIAVAEEKMVAGCVYLDTLSENSDMGKTQLHPKYTYDAQERVIKRAVRLGATHIVWLHNYPSGAAAVAYQCPQ
jgi:hypothetical protein